MDCAGTPNGGGSDGSKPNGSMVVYDRARMMEIRETLSSRTRPDNLSIEFNDDDGMFSPAKWIENYWIKAGIVNKVVTNTRKKPVDKIKAEAEMDGTVLSPQRKGFSSGCRASSPKVGDESSADKKNNWRGSTSKSNGIDFKPSFQKTSLENQRNSRNNGSSLGNWRSTIADRDTMYKSGTSRNKYGNERGHTDEKLPEWLDDGPSSMSEVIELKGFEDENRRERRNKLKAKKEAKEQQERGSEKTAEKLKETAKAGSLAQSSSDVTRDGKEKSAVESLLNNATKLAASDYPTMRNAVSDLEFATLLGMKIDENTQPRPQHVPTVPQTTGSRLSRFFTKNAKIDSPEISRRASVEHPTAPAADNKVVPGILRLEDLEKSFVTPEKPEQSEAKVESKNLKFATLLGMKIDENTQPKPQQVPTVPQTTGSRLSRFFTKNAQMDSPEISRRASVEHPTAPDNKVVPGILRLEDLEKSFVTPKKPEQPDVKVESKNNVANLLPPLPPQPQHQPSQPLPPGLLPSNVGSPYVPPPLPVGIPPIHPGQINPLAMAAAAHGHSNPVTALQDPKVLGTAVNVLTHIQVQQILAVNPDARANPTFPAYVGQLMQQNMATIAAAGAVGALNIPHPMHGAGQRPSNGPNLSSQNDEMPTQQSAKVPSTFMPTSVLRQMNKAAAHPTPQSTSARSSEANSVVGAPSHNIQTVPTVVPGVSSHDVHKTSMSPETVRLEPENMMNVKAQNGDGEVNQHHPNRSALEQQYSMVVNAMTSGLSMGAYRPPTH